MIDFVNKDVIFWDFDGVIINSEEIRTSGFREVLQEYPKAEIDKLVVYHKKNGGLSRYVKFRYFFENLRKESISDQKVNELSNKFSELMKQQLQDENLLIPETLAFIQKNYQKYQMHIVSGSDEKELQLICSNLKISKYFKSIHGSPTPKKQLVSNLLKNAVINPEKCVLIGDSINDYEAAKENNVQFFGYNNIDLKKRGLNYLLNFE